MTQMLRRVTYLVAPRLAPIIRLWHSRRQRDRQLVAKAEAFRRDLNAIQDLDAMAEFVLRSRQFGPSQKATEIVALLRLLREIQPKYLCEIGSYKGGTLALFCQVSAPEAQILAIDLSFTAQQLKALPHFARPGQTVTLLKADSHASGTLSQVEHWLGSQQFDFLFIDGDHSLEGVSRDFEMYAPYTRTGGIIALHDIVPDYRTRFGTRTKYSTGEVPAFWAQLRQNQLKVKEFIEEQEQDGFGIGVIEWQP